MFPCLIRSGTNAVGKQSEFRRRLSTTEFRNSSGSPLSGMPQPAVADLSWSQFTPSGSRMEAMVKFIFTDSSRENRQGQQALARSFERRGAHLSVCLGLCRQPSALITEL